jgi:arylformamidase
VNKLLTRYKNLFLLGLVIIFAGVIMFVSVDDPQVFAIKVRNRLRAYWVELKPEVPMVEGVRIFRDFPYGEDEKQRMDIYAPEQSMNAPIIVWLHGGGFEGGDKAERNGYINKVNRWVPMGFIVITVNTRLLPDAKPYEQLQDLASAIVTLQAHAKEWGGDANKVFISGYSSAGILITSLSASPSLVTKQGGLPWLAGISIDASSLNIPKTMSHWHPSFFDRAYGSDELGWKRVSPMHLLNERSLPLLLICTELRRDSPCNEAATLAKKADDLGVMVQVVPEDLSHGDTDYRLGIDEKYTHIVETFMSQQDPDVEYIFKSQDSR